MTEIKLNQPAAIFEEKKSPVEEKKVTKVEAFKCKKPCDWMITPLEDDEIEARSSSTGETFNGSISEFNARLRA